MRFSIVVPYRNRQAWLPRALRALSEQRHQDFELLLVDNGSSDASRAICEAFAEEYAAAKFSIRLLSEPEAGACRARNLGLREVTSDFVLFFDSDDEISPDFLFDADDLLKTQPDLDIVCARTRLCLTNGKLVTRGVVKTNDPADQILCSMLTTQGMIVRTSFLRKPGGWDEHLPKWNDWELGLRLLLQKPRIFWLPKAYHKLHQHAESLTGRSWASTYDALRPALKAARSLIGEDRRLLRALACRQAVVAAELHLEGKKDAARELLQDSLSLTSAAHWIYLYRCMGGRGAWRIYRIFL
ncbi:MAG: glycosyltransferase family 2 protein [Alloprevotella sp.]|nr:glycosyltransferase family 2 protein [Alloprevotella sp.]